MKRTVSTIFLVQVFAAAFLQAQITVTNADMPLLNDTIRISVARSFVGINTALTDSNYTWDFSFLMPDSQRVVKFLSPGATPYALFSLNSAYGTRNYAPDPIPFALLGSAPTNGYDFFNVSTANFRQTGYGVTAMGSALPLLYSKNDIIYSFPVTYSKMDSSQSGFGYPLPGLGYYGKNQNRVNTVDGWGKLKIPYGEFDVVRVKSVINETDTIYLDTLQFGLQFPRPTRYEFKWLGKGCKIPFLQINATAGIGGGAITINEVLYRDSMWTDMRVSSIVTSTCAGTSEGSLEAAVMGGKAPYTYLWNTGQTTKYISGLSEGSYSVTITDKYGKVTTYSDSITARHQDLGCLVIPNAFTPNEDNVNDVWNIRNISDYPDCKVEIYNRWGSILYSSTGYTKPWDGKYNGENSPTGTYYYTIKLKENTYKGSLTLIR